MSGLGERSELKRLVAAATTSRRKLAQATAEHQNAHDAQIAVLTQVLFRLAPGPDWLLVLESTDDGLHRVVGFSPRSSLLKTVADLAPQDSELGAVLDQVRLRIEDVATLRAAMGRPVLHRLARPPWDRPVWPHPDPATPADTEPHDEGDHRDD